MVLRYRDGNIDRRRVNRDHTGAERTDTFIPPVDREAIFRELILQEVRYGRLNKASRARIVRYACGMGLSATQAGKLIHTCQEEVARERRSSQTPHQLTLVRAEPRRSRRGSGLLACLIIMTAAVVFALLRQRLW